MNANELRQKAEAELKDMLVELRKEQFDLRMQKASGALTNPKEIKRVRRQIARVKTVINQTAQPAQDKAS
ncbi:MAG: 50S ribosomal protein L29 [Wenzhouxiangella sp.]|nr:50S ribosomal protein L29 [Wenzhouxiangella sp.]MDR9453614.1 50S ribosomal protein L29 [Wenzhouxiangella sp.]